ncbi:ABC transporter, partial [Pelomonas sp. HMWF004]
VWQRPNLLLLDEPTNHLDLNTREALSMALNEFEGTVMLVSHDRALLREVCDEFWLVADGVVKPFDGDLDDYQRWLLDQSKEAARAAKKQSASSPAPAPAKAAAAPTPAPAPREDRKASVQARAKVAEQTRPLRKEMEAIDKRLHALATERAEIEAQLADGAAASAIAEMGKRLKAISDQLEADEARWLVLGEQIEAMGA